jgi:hypothetical protein
MRKILEEALEQAKIKPLLSIGIDVIRQVYQGKMWVVGGTISSLATLLLYGNEFETDVDLLLQEKVDLSEIPTPDGWGRGKTIYGNLRFLQNTNNIDIWCLPDMPDVKDTSIENYLAAVPLNVQSLAYDFDEHKVYGNTGIDALERRIVTVNNMKSALYCASRKPGRTVNDLVLKKAKKLGFTPILPT